MPINDRMAAALCSQAHAEGCLGLHEYARHAGLQPDDVVRKMLSGDIPVSSVFINITQAEACTRQHIEKQ